MAGNSKQYRVSSPRDYEDRNGDTKTAWVNLGVAFEKDGKITVLLNAAPFPGPDGQAKLILMEPDEDDRDGRGGGRGRDQERSGNDRGRGRGEYNCDGRSRGRGHTDLNDEMPDF